MRLTEVERHELWLLTAKLYGDAVVAAVERILTARSVDMEAQRDSAEQFGQRVVADMADMEARIRALHTRRETKVYSDEECAENNCDHDGPCFIEADAVCAHCADQTEPGGGWEHLIRPDAYWPCATIALLDAAPAGGAE